MKGAKARLIDEDLFDDIDFYGGDDVWDQAVEADSMTPNEAAFMRGWDDAG
ncbi:hypothetical protein HYS47_05660 [Candidatus Woesearchaeota archaeon]|nr:hypothetical protein [Candidatus Woesearchaeota archaeon]